MGLFPYTNMYNQKQKSTWMDLNKADTSERRCFELPSY